MSVALTNDGSDVISRNVILDRKFVVSLENIEDVFCIDYTVSWIKQKGFKQIGLQFPDELLCVAADVCQKLCNRSGEFCFILGDSSFAGCCVDEIAGQRFHIDALIHYGRACLSKPSGRLPLLYVFGQLRPLQLPDSERLLHIAQDLLNRRMAPSPSVILTYDFRFQAIAHALYQKLSDLSRSQGDYVGSVVVWSEPDLLPPAESSIPSAFDDGLPPVVFKRCGRAFHCINRLTSDHQASWMLVHVGPESEKLAIHRILLAFPEVSQSNCFLLNPESLTVAPLETALTSFLKRRLYLVEKAKDAQKVGILMGTLSVQGYQSIVDRVQRILKRCGRFYVTLVVGKLNEAKLANLPELDLLVLIACPETSLLDSREMLIPIITPFELECALSGLATASRSGEDPVSTARLLSSDNLTVDFHDLLPGGSAYLPEDQLIPCLPSPDEEIADVSLITGKIRFHHPPKLCDTTDNPNESTLAIRGDWSVVHSDSSGFQRTWYGLDPQLGQTPVGSVRPGLDGLPVQYKAVAETNPNLDM